MESLTPYFYLALAFLAGCAAVAARCYLGDGKEVITVGGGGDARMAALLSSSKNCFYYRNLKTGKDWFSRKLRELFGLSSTAGFEAFLQQLPIASRSALEQKISALQAGEVASFSLEIEDEGNAQRVLECYGTMVEAEGDQHLVLWWQDITALHTEKRRLAHENERTKLEIRRLSNMLNALPVPLWQRDEEGKIRYCNLAYLEAAEETTDAKGGESLEIYPQGRALASRALKTGEMQKERRHVVLRGERKLFDFMEIPWEDRKNLSGLALDRNELEELTARIQDMAHTQSNLMETITSGISIFGSDQRIKYYNQAMLRMWKLEENWLDQKPKYGDVLEKMRENRVLPEQANFPAFKQRRIRLFTDLLEPHEEFYYLPDGRTIRQLAIPDASGGILFADEDVTDRLALERSYNTLIAVQRETLDHLAEGVAVFGQDGRLKLHNPIYRRVWNLSEAFAQIEPHLNDLLEKQKALYQCENWEDFRQHMMGLISQRKAAKMQIERTDGRIFDIIAVPLPDGQTLLNYVDLTDSMLVERSLREKNEALEEADRIKSEFLANVSYELRSPLTSIRGFYEMLMQQYAGTLTPSQAEYVQNIGAASEHLKNLIDDILDIASIEAGYLQLDIARVDVLAMMTAVQSMMRDRAEQAGLKLHFDCPLDIGAMDADQNRLKQAIYNLLSNAVKYTEAGGEVTLRVEPKTILATAAAVGAGKGREVEVICITVKDSGIGIPEAEQEMVFEKFYRTSLASRKSSGTGLGLAMVKSFIELHGGQVYLQSTVGEGTAITCMLPRRQPQEDVVIPLPKQATINELKH